MNANEKEHHAMPELTSEHALQEWLREILENATWDCGLYQTDVLSFEEVQSKPLNKGLVIHLPDGTLFPLTIEKANPNVAPAPQGRHHHHQSITIPNHELENQNLQ